MILLFMNQGAEIVTPTVQVFKSTIDKIKISDYKILATDKSNSHFVDLVRIQMCVEIPIQEIDLFNNKFIPISSKGFFKSILSARSLITNGLAIKALEQRLRTSDDNLTVVVCKSNDYTDVEPVTTYPEMFKHKNITILTTEELRSSK